MATIDPLPQSAMRTGALHAVPTDMRFLKDAIDTGVLDGAEPYKLDLRGIFAAVYRNRWLFIVIVPLFMLAGVVAIKLQTARYDAYASVQIEQQAARVLNGNDLEPNIDYQDADRFLKTELDILSSRAMAERVAQSEHLFGDATFFEEMGVRPPAKKVGAMTLRETRDEAVISLLRTNFGSDLPRDSRVVSIRFRSPDPQLAARIANAFATNFVRGNLERKVQATASARDLLSGQLAQVKAKLEGSEAQLNDYARSAGLIDTSLPSSNSNAIGARSLTTASLVALNDAYVAAQADRIQREQRWVTAMKTSADNMGEVLGNQAIQELLRQRAEKAADLADQRKRRKDDFPLVAQAKADLAELNSQIASIARNIRKSVQDQYLTALHQEQDLAVKVKDLKSATLSEQDRSIKYNFLKREVDTNRTLFDGLLQRYKDLNAASNVAANNLSVVDLAEAPTAPTSPKKSLTLLASLFAGFALAGCIMTVHEMLDESIHSPVGAEKKLGIPVIGLIPQAPKRSNMKDQVTRPDTPLSEAYASLLVSIGLDSWQGLPRSLCVTSSEPREGKTTTAYAIAYGLARRGIKTLLIDADLRRPRVHRQMGIANEFGFSDILMGHAELSKTVLDTDVDNLDVLTSGPIPPNPSELLSGGALRKTLEQATRYYGIVILDASPVLGLADAIAISQSVAATLFVVAADQAKLRRVRNAIRRLRDVRANMLGAVITKFSAGRFGPYQEYGENYYQYRIEA